MAIAVDHGAPRQTSGGSRLSDRVGREGVERRMANAIAGASFRQDLKYAARLLRLNPGFAATAILSLALGIAANTSIFTLVDQVLLRLLPVENPQQLVQFRMEGGRVGSQSGDGVHTFSYPLYLALGGQNTVFSSMIRPGPGAGEHDEWRPQ